MTERTPLADLTTMRVGGMPGALLRPTSEPELSDALRPAWAEAEDEPDSVLVLGGGSNVVAPDEGIPGPVVLTDAVRGIESIAASDGRVHLRIAAGEPWDSVVEFAVSRGLAGIAQLSGIPGSTGAAPVQNIGAYGVELGSTLVAVDFLDAETGERERLSAADLELGYRMSAIKRGRRGVVLAVELALDAGGRTPAAYAQLAAALEVPVGTEVPVAPVREAVLEIRAAKGMLTGAGMPDSCGSFFMNPIVDENWARSLPPEAPRHQVGESARALTAPIEAGPSIRAFANRREVKLSAAWLIEAAGIPKGYALPGSRARISPLHSLSITNAGGATAAEVRQLAAFVQARVSADFGVNLQPEPIIL